MARLWFGTFMFGALFLVSPVRAGEDALKKELAELNVITGNEPMRGALKALVDSKDHTKKLLAYAMPAAKKKELSYNGAMVLALAASDLKDMKVAEVYFRVCMEQAAKLQSHEKMKQSYGLLIELYYEYKQYANCSRICKELLELNTDDGKERQVVGLTSNPRGEPEFTEPRDRFDTAQRLRPAIFEIYVKSTAKQGKYDQAIKLVDNLLKKNDDWIDRYLKGWVLREAARYPEAADVYEQIIREVSKERRLEPEDRDAYVERFRYEASNVYVEMKKIDKATEHLEFLIKKRPEDPSFYNDLGYIWADNDMKLDEAEKMIRKALELDRARRKKRPNFDPKTDRDNGAYLDSLGWVLFKQKKYDEAKEWLIKATEDKNAQHIEIFDHLGDVHMALGEREAAVKAWQKGLEVVTEARRDQRLKAEVEKKLEKAKESK